jgi:hypothetical protein
VAAALFLRLLATLAMTGALLLTVALILWSTAPAAVAVLILAAAATADLARRAPASRLEP